MQGFVYEMEKTLVENSKKDIKKLGSFVGIPEKKLVVKIGSAKLIILEEAKKIKADLIIVGSHGRQGLGVILGSTANAILHSAQCDVLAVRLK